MSALIACLFAFSSASPYMSRESVGKSQDVVLVVPVSGETSSFEERGELGVLRVGDDPRVFANCIRFQLVTTFPRLRLCNLGL